ncbi:PepSY domain-containing protein [Neobacillus sp. PS3-34]|uniref:PepSY domain-containing protein n=1 Tax=Neobacillus sp. PS3-34 TaxID=3070678 RepID=UPI0027DF1FDD|nr:PepSY domain-containing protein [Neobacillus sp. PS3-34]WML47266.1 PepSY domain-containing protein [Neobacillus sp. PS3-34]
MNWKSFLLGAAVGLAGGYALREAVSQRTDISAEKVLSTAKKQFKLNGPISGSWIHMESEPFVKNQIKYMVYKGGITRGNHEKFEFIADSSTGTILEVNPLSL